MADDILRIPTRPERARLSSLTTAIRLLKAFTNEERELGISDLAKRLGVAKSTVHRLASTLTSEGLLEQNPETDRYRLGVTLFTLGALVRRRMDISAEAKVHLINLRSEVEENVRLAILDGAQTVYMHDYESVHPVRLRAQTGQSKPAFCTAEGLVLLTGRSDAEIDAVLAAGTPAQTPRTMTDPREIRARIAEARRSGYAIEDEESEIGMRAIAAPIRSAEGRVIAAVAVAGPRTRLRKRMFPALINRVVATADDISARLGWRPGL